MVVRTCATTRAGMMNAGGGPTALMRPAPQNAHLMVPTGIKGVDSAEDVVKISFKVSTEEDEEDPTGSFMNHHHGKNDTSSSSSSLGGGDRRQIFGSFWKKQKGSHESMDTMQEEDDCPPREHHHMVDMRYFSPPPEHQRALKEYHALLDDFPEGLGSDDLPEIPTPLLRLTSASECRGMYPLNSPISILREPKYSPHYNDDGDDIPRDDEEYDPVGPLSSSHPSLQYVPGHDARNLRRTKTEPVKSTRFDPRVVVTAFGKEGTGQWYTPRELETFKADTFELAHHCMLFVPQIASQVAAAAIAHPHRSKKNRLFSLPILNALPDELDFYAHMERVEAASRESVKKILLVDPNRAILKLFQKGILKLFPHARVMTAQCGEDALRLYHREMSNGRHGRSFDVILAEERLYQTTRKASPGHAGDFSASNGSVASERPMTGARSMTNLASQPYDNHVGEKRGSFGHLNILESERPAASSDQDMTGSELMQHIRAMEEQHNNDNNTSEDQWKALMIGVSVRPDRDDQLFKERGADFVWGKPPPPMTIPLRNKMLSTLLTKRHNPDLCMNIPEFAGDT